MYIRRIAAVAVLALLLAGCTARGPALPKAAPAKAEPKMITLRDVVGMTVTDAHNFLVDQGVLPQFRTVDGDYDGSADDDANFVVVSMAPAAGSSVAPLSSVDVVVKPLLIEVPDVTGQAYYDAGDTIESAELRYTSRQDPLSGSEDFTVVKQVPAAGKMVPPGTKVTLVLRVPKIVFSVSGNARHATITYTVPDGSFDIEQVANAGVPWSKSFTDDGSEPYANMSAQDLDGTSISCTIKVDGETVSHRTSTGRYAIVTCSMNG